MFGRRLIFCLPLIVWTYSEISFSLMVRCILFPTFPGWFSDAGHALSHIEWKYAIRVINNITCISFTIAYMLAVLEVILPEARLHASVSAGTWLISGPGKRICDVFATFRPERFSQRTPFQLLMGLSFNPLAYNNTPMEEKKMIRKGVFQGSGSKRKN